MHASSQTPNPVGVSNSNPACFVVAAGPKRAYSHPFVAILTLASPAFLDLRSSDAASMPNDAEHVLSVRVADSPLIPTLNLVSRTNQLASRGKTKEKMSAHLPIRPKSSVSVHDGKSSPPRGLIKLSAGNAILCRKQKQNLTWGAVRAEKKARNDPVTLKHCLQLLHPDGRASCSGK